MRKRMIMIVVLLPFLLGAAFANNVAWIEGLGSSIPPAWSISPANPGGTDVISFAGPLDEVYCNKCHAERALGGKPYLDINYYTKTIKLKFQGPAPQYCTTLYKPAVGLAGDFGPLTPGNWTFKCTHVLIAFTINFTVGGSGGGTVIYVDKHAVYPPTGKSWARAYRNLQDALAVVLPGGTIHVADGTYRPDQGGSQVPGNRLASFKIPDDVTVLGGFAGYGAPDPDARDTVAHPTVLSGDLLQNDHWSILNMTDNSYHVVSSMGSGTIDGLTIRAGNADGYGDLGYGAGLFLKGSSLIVNDCKIQYNKADYGGGIAVQGQAPSFMNTEITGNCACVYGGGLHNQQGDIEMINCLVSGNRAGSNTSMAGDAIFNVMGSLDIINCTIADNIPEQCITSYRSAIVDSVCGPGYAHRITIKNSILRNNGKEVSADPGVVTIWYSNIQGGQGGHSGFGNINKDPRFKKQGHYVNDCQWVYDRDGYTLQKGSPSIDAGKKSYLPVTIQTDLLGQSRVQGTEVDQGAYECQLAALVYVPHVLLLKQSDAEASILRVNLVVGKVTEDYSSTVPVGRVISQNPKGGTQAQAGSAVDLVISKGPGLVQVPYVVGQPQAAAQSIITAAGLKVGSVTQAYSNTVPAGHVISQNPVAGTTVQPGSLVHIVISKGKALVFVPHVVQLQQSQAEAAILAAGLTVGTITHECSSTVPSGRVISQTPAGGTQVNPGSPVHLVISKGPGFVQVPYVIGQTQAAAQTLIVNACLTVGTITQAYSATVPAGRVISQNPSAGSTVPRCSPVNLVISKGPAPSNWELDGCVNICVDVPNPPPWHPVPVNGTFSYTFYVTVPSEYKLELTEIPGVGGSWTINPSTGTLAPGVKSLVFSIHGTNVNLSSLPPGNQKVATVRIYTRSL